MGPRTEVVGAQWQWVREKTEEMQGIPSGEILWGGVRNFWLPLCPCDHDI